MIFPPDFQEDWGGFFAPPGKAQPICPHFHDFNRPVKGSPQRQPAFFFDENCLASLQLTAMV